MHEDQCHEDLGSGKGTMKMIPDFIASWYKEMDFLVECYSLVLRILPDAQLMLSANSFSLYRQMNEYKINGSTPGDGGILGRVEDVLGAVYLIRGVPEVIMEAICKEDQKWMKKT